MKYIRQFAIIIAISCVGELFHYLLPFPVPASIYGMVIMLTLLVSKRLKLEDVKEMVSLLRYCSNNLNQYAKRANETGSIYAEDIRDLQNRQNEIWEIAKEILARLATIQ